MNDNPILTSYEIECIKEGAIWFIVAFTTIVPALMAFNIWYASL